MSVSFSSRLPAVIAGLEAGAGLVVQKTVSDLEAAAKSNAPVDTGALQNSITGEMTGALSGQVRATAEYAAYVELGTRKMSPQPYMTPAAESVRPAFEAAMGQIIK